MYRFYEEYPLHPSDAFFMEGLNYFSKTMPSHVPHALKRHGCIVKRLI